MDDWAVSGSSHLSNSNNPPLAVFKRPIHLQDDDELFVTQEDSDVTLSDGPYKRQKHERSLLSSPYRLAAFDLETNECTPKYRASVEGVPRLGPYHPSFKLAEEEITRACDIFMGASADLEAEGYSNHEIKVVCGDDDVGLAQCRNPASFYPTVRSIAVLGPAGAGKSESLNSLMDTTKAAFTHDGERGTYVAHEYRCALKFQTLRYVVKVPFLSREEIENLVRKQFMAVHSHLFPTTDESEEEGNDAIGEERASFNSYQTGIGFFCDLFADRDEFRTEKDTTDFFKNMKPESEDEILPKLLGYIRAFLEKRKGLVNNEESYERDTEQELDAVLRDIARPAKRHYDSRKPCPWPLVRKVVIYQKQDLLDTGVILADLPGSNDSDELVSANTRCYLKQAGFILIFLPYKRIENSDLDKYLRNCISLGKMGETRLVVTMIDQMKSIDSEDEAHLNNEDRQALAEARNKVEYLQRMVIETDQAKKLAGSDTYRDLDLKLGKLYSERTEAKADLHHKMIDIRCREIEHKFKGKFRSLRGSKYDPDLPIHFISNTVYRDHVAGFDQDQPPKLSVKASGIPALRRELMRYPTRGKLERLHMLSTNRLRSIFEGIDGILTKSTMERKNEVRSVIHRQLNEVCLPVDGAIDDISSAYRTSIFGKIERNEPTWKEIAGDVLLKWESINAGTFQGILVRGGDWCRHKKLGDISLNQDVQRVFDKELIDGFNDFEDRFKGIQADIDRNAHDNFDNLKNAIQNCPAAAGHRLGPFMQYINFICKDTSARIATTFDDLKFNIEGIRTRATITADVSFTRHALSPAIDRCLLINKYRLQDPDQDTQPPIKIEEGLPVKRGRGKRSVAKPRPKAPNVKQARLQVLRAKILGDHSDESVFKEVGNYGQKDLQTALEDWRLVSGQIMSASRIEILRDFDRRFQTTNVKVEEHSDAVETLKRAAAEAIAIIDGPLLLYLKQCYEFEGKEFPQ